MKKWSQFEKRIEDTNAWYTRRGLGVVAKIPNGTKTIRVGGQPRIMATNKTGCDFIGHLGGHPVAFDAKSTESKTSFRFDLVKDHQKAFLSAFSKTGGKAFLLVQFNPLNKVFLVDIDTYLEAEKECLEVGRKSLKISFFEGMEVAESAYFLDYEKAF